MVDWARLGREAVSWIYPDRCELCLRIGLPPICTDCLALMKPLEDPVHHNFAGNALNMTASVFPFEGAPGKAVKLLKYSRATPLGKPMSEILCSHLQRLALPEFDVVVPVPIHWSRQCKRGFNQSVMLCEALKDPEPSVDLLFRVKNTRPQVGLTRQERLTNLKGAFQAGSDAKGLRVLLIDDVTTSGGTATACAEALKAQGAAYVGMLAFCGE